MTSISSHPSIGPPGYLTTRDLERMFGRSRMTIYNWRKHLGLPYHVFEFDERISIRFKLEEVQEWSERNEKLIVRVLHRKMA